MNSEHLLLIGCHPRKKIGHEENETSSVTETAPSWRSQKLSQTFEFFPSQPKAFIRSSFSMPAPPPSNQQKTQKRTPKYPWHRTSNQNSYEQQKWQPDRWHPWCHHDFSPLPPPGFRLGAWAPWHQFPPTGPWRHRFLHPHALVVEWIPGWVHPGLTTRSTYPSSHVGCPRKLGSKVSRISGL